MRNRLRTLLTWIAGLFPAWEWEQLRTTRFSAGLGLCVVGGLVTGWAADKNLVFLVLALVLLTAGVAIASCRFAQ